MIDAACGCEISGLDHPSQITQHDTAAPARVSARTWLERRSRASAAAACVDTPTGYGHSAETMVRAPPRFKCGHHEEHVAKPRPDHRGGSIGRRRPAPDTREAVFAPRYGHCRSVSSWRSEFLVRSSSVM